MTWDDMGLATRGTEQMNKSFRRTETDRILFPFQMLDFSDCFERSMTHLDGRHRRAHSARVRLVEEGLVVGADERRDFSELVACG